MSFDLSLARGLDYYTGVIYEAVITSLPEELLKAAPGTTVRHYYHLKCGNVKNISNNILGRADKEY